MARKFYRFARSEQNTRLNYLLRWLAFATAIGALVGSASAFFLWSLQWATNYRNANFWVIALLPIGGFTIGLIYHYYGKEVVRGNNQLLDEYHRPRKVIPFKMAPLVLFGTVATHFFGGSAGREGTAVQMGGAIADQFTKHFKLKSNDRRILLIMGISAGFSSVFGTPIAGAIFAIEVTLGRRLHYEALIPSFLAAFIADYFCHAWGVPHTLYTIAEVPEINPANLSLAAVAGITFGLTARLFSRSTHFITSLFSKKVTWPPLRPVIGGAIVASIVLSTSSTTYIGLGIPTIAEAFESQLNSYDFLLKIAFTALTLGAGFKGGEVTPLFFVGATLGNALFWIIPLPMSLLAGMGFVAVFAGATHTPIASASMGMELFGFESGVFLGVACAAAYFFSGSRGVYEAQRTLKPKYARYLGTKLPSSRKR